ncbi:MAG TPA: rhodanese-like domain-containing protein [Croceibacterium sp.]|jgi:rhodanese-related sulfurtransferase|nr:rhodanese-like domain-containing protein [Croceibacterium sp.]
MPQTISPAEAQRRIEAGAVLIDIRNPDEYARAHIPCARNLPLTQIGRIEGAPEVIFHCKSGMRTSANAQALQATTDAPVFLLEGGFDAWQKAGLDCKVDKAQPLEIIRQVQIGAGSLVLLGVLLGFLVSPALFGLAAFVGAGLVMAGTTGWCGMAKLLALAPWNRRATM